jgi:hypothetical protein
MSDYSHAASNTHSRMLSEVASRSSTPPLGGSGSGIVGSAPERTKTRNQLKKERREKAKAQQSQTASQSIVQESSISSSPAKSTPVSEEVAPIIAKQKKQKKEKNKKIEDKPQSRGVQEDKKGNKPVVSQQPTPPVDVLEEPVESTEPEDADETVAQSVAEDEVANAEPEGPKEPYLLKDLYADLTRQAAPTMQELLASKTSPFGSMISQMLASGDIPRDHPFFAPPPLLSKDYKLPHDSRKGDDYLQAHGYTSTSAFDYVYIPRNQRRELLDGSPIIIGDEPVRQYGKDGKEIGVPKEDLLKSCLISPSGAVMRHLNSKEIDRVLDLEERRMLYREGFGDDVGDMQSAAIRLENNDNINLEGGPEELVRRGESKGVVWVYGDGDDGTGAELGEDTEDELIAGEGYDDDDVWDEGDGFDGNDFIDDEDREDYNGGGVNVARERKVNLRNMDLEALQRRVEETLREREAARKEVERLEKSMAKSNKDMNKWREGLLRWAAKAQQG